MNFKELSQEFQISMSERVTGHLVKIRGVHQDWDPTICITISCEWENFTFMQVHVNGQI